MPWLYFTLTFLFATFAGIVVFGEGAVFLRTSGQVFQGVLSLSCFAFIVWALWHYGWRVGLLEVLVIFGGAAVGESIMRALIHRR